MTASDLTADLPAPREDEPSTLRQDIADELADHLACAVRREQLRDGSAGNVDLGARPHPSPLPEGEGESGGEPRRLGSDDWWAQPTLRRVLERFGDPRAVARKLWWDAMREKIMGQRILTVMAAVAVLACCALIGWMCQTLMQMQNAQRDMLRESRAQNAKLLEQFQSALAGLKSAPADEAPSEWNQLTVKCTFDTEDGPPAAGVIVQLQSGSENTKGIPAIDVTTGADGIADFGKVLYGRYRLQFRAPNGMQRSSDVSVMPGQAKQATMICPNGDGLTAITPRVAPNASDPPPAGLIDQLWYWVTLTRVSSGQFWAQPQSERPIRWVIGPQGQLLDVTNLEPLPVRYFRDNAQEGALPRSAIPEGPLSVFVSHDVLLPSEIGTQPLMVEAGNYAVSSVSVCLMSAEAGDMTRLLSLLPPERMEDRRQRTGSFGGYNRPEDKAQQDPDFAVVYGRPGTVDVALREARFDYMRRVVAAAPKYIAMRMTGSTDNRFLASALGWNGGRGRSGLNLDGMRADLSFRGAPEEFKLVSGAEVLAWEAVGMTQLREFQSGPRGRLPEYLVRAVIFVTPDERIALNMVREQMIISPVPEETVRSTLDPEARRKIEESLEAKPDGAGETPGETAKPVGDGEPLPPNIAAPPKSET